MKNAKRTAAGLHLWEVTVEHRETPSSKWQQTTNLLVTTAREDDMALAIQKGDTFVRKHKRKYPDARVVEAKYTGQIDA